jgi:hypothetical protein
MNPVTARPDCARQLAASLNAPNRRRHFQSGGLSTTTAAAAASQTSRRTASHLVSSRLRSDPGRGDASSSSRRLLPLAQIARPGGEIAPGTRRARLGRRPKGQKARIETNRSAPVVVVLVLVVFNNSLAPSHALVSAAGGRPSGSWSFQQSACALWLRINCSCGQFLFGPKPGRLQRASRPAALVRRCRLWPQNSPLEGCPQRVTLAERSSRRAAAVRRRSVPPNGRLACELISRRAIRAVVALPRLTTGRH